MQTLQSLGKRSTLFISGLTGIFEIFTQNIRIFSAIIKQYSIFGSFVGLALLIFSPDWVTLVIQHIIVCKFYNNLYKADIQYTLIYWTRSNLTAATYKINKERILRQQRESRDSSLAIERNLQCLVGRQGYWVKFETWACLVPRDCHQSAHPGARSMICCWRVDCGDGYHDYQSHQGSDVILNT